MEVYHACPSILQVDVHGKHCVRFTRSVRTNSGCGEADKEDGSDEEEFDKEAFESGTMAGTGPFAGTG